MKKTISVVSLFVVLIIGSVDLTRHNGNERAFKLYCDSVEMCHHNFEFYFDKAQYDTSHLWFEKQGFYMHKTDSLFDVMYK